MAIKGLTDKTEAAFPRIGILRKGGEKKGNRPGADLNYFRFTTDSQPVLDAFNATYGSEPQSLNVFLPYATPDANFQAWKEHWVSGGLQHRCDGETCAIWQQQDGTYSREPKPCPGGCKEVGRLAVIIPELKRLAYVTMLTSSINDIIEITANLEAAYALRGDLRGIPFVLRRVPRMISTPSGKDGQRARREKWLVNIEPAPEWVALQLRHMQMAALPGSVTVGQSVIDGATGEVLQLEAPADVDAEMDAEFDSLPTHPDSYHHKENENDASPELPSLNDVEFPEGFPIDRALGWAMSQEMPDGHAVFGHKKHAENSLCKLRKENVGMENKALQLAWKHKIQEKQTPEPAPLDNTELNAELDAQAAAEEQPKF